MQRQEEDDDAMWGDPAGLPSGDETPKPISTVKQFTLKRMVPPGTLQYYFMVFGDGNLLLRWNGAGIEGPDTAHACSFTPMHLLDDADTRPRKSRDFHDDENDFDDENDQGEDEDAHPHSTYCRPPEHAKDPFDGGKTGKSTSPTKPFAGGHGAILANCGFHKIEVRALSGRPCF